ncbi:MAG: hypothetical protein C0394_09395 [Syntrophus sp. (in: bacteria)]|nr:hypothetical protein [Syntrophus sp. (in: bacteria)]
MTKKRMLHVVAAMGVVMVMLVCAFPRMAMAADASGTVSVNGTVNVIDTLGNPRTVVTSVTNSNADTLNGGLGTATVTGANVNITGTTSINTGAAAITNIGFAGGANNLTGTNALLGATSINNNGNFATNINTGTSTSAVTIGNALNTTNLLGGANTINAVAANNVITAATTNAITGGTGNTISATTGSNAITAVAGSNTITGNVNNTMTATTGNNAIIATAGSNTMSANAANQSNTISAIGAGGVNNITAPTNVQLGTEPLFSPRQIGALSLMSL